MAEVTSFTADRILAMAEDWVRVADNQEQTDAFVTMLRAFLDTHVTQMMEFQEVTIPNIIETMQQNDISVADLNDNVLPDLQQALDANTAALEDIESVALPNLQTDLDSIAQNAIDRPKVYVQAEAPTNPDDEDRYLVVGDTWNDSDDDNRLRVWNGTEWSTFAIDIPDLSITVKKFKTSSHMIY